MAPHYGVLVFTLAIICTFGYSNAVRYINVNVKAFFDINIGGEYAGRIEFGLFNDTCPRTVANFLAMCDSTLPGGKGFPGSIFHRVIKNFMIQGGNIGGLSLYGGNFADENMIIKNYIGMLGMANAGANTNADQIYINTVETHWLDGGHTVFGIVLSGMDVVKKIEYNPTNSSNDRPIQTVEIFRSGSIPIPAPFTVPEANVVQQVTVNLKAFFDIQIGGEYVGRIVFGLFNDTCPLTVANFIAFCDGKGPGGLSYQGATFHRVIKQFMIQGGDVVYGNGYGVSSIYGGGYFADENMIIDNYIGMLGMANLDTPNTNGCQFYINTVETHWLDNKHTVFGVVLSGMDVVKMIENNPTGPGDKPILTVEISYSGSYAIPAPFTVPVANVLVP
jgi:peptidyl-prolyl cis-trans isomerase B (cyclophilin B)